MALNPSARPHEVRIDPDGLFAFLGVPDDPKGVVLFAHASASGRNSPRNTYVAVKLREASLATLLLDLLTPEEESELINVFDVELLAHRLIEATDWVEDQPELRGLPFGYFGASTGAGAAMLAGARRPHDVAAIVSRSGRPDLSMDALPAVKAPTLLIVGGLDTPVIELNRAARTRMRTEVELVVVPEATHLFEERGALDHVALLARDWFLAHFAGVVERETRHGRPADLH